MPRRPEPSPTSKLARQRKRGVLFRQRPESVASPLVGDVHDKRHLRLGILLLSWGMQAIVTQSLILREALVLMFGSEFAWGVVLFAWLLGVAVGALLGGWAVERLRRPDAALVVVLTLLSMAACIELWVFRGARGWLGVQAGEFPPLPTTAFAAILFVSPVGALVGLAFPLACCVTVAGGRSESIADQRPRTAARGGLSLGTVYALESAGSLIGGAVFSFWAVEHLAPIQIALCCAAVTLASCAALPGVTRRRAFASVCLAALAVAALSTSLLAGDELNRRLVDRRWRNIAPGYELCAEEESRYQNLAVGRRDGQFTLYCDGRVSADFPDPYTHVPLAHFWMCQHPAPRNVLVVGGGAEGLLSEILRHPVERIDYVEPDPRQVALLKPFLSEADRGALEDPRTTVHHLDARFFVKTQVSRFDLVIARLPEPISALRARLYTDEFFGELRRAMTPRSVLCLTAVAAPGRLTGMSAQYLASIRATLLKHFPHIIVGWGNPAHILAATEPELVSTDPAELARRYAARNVQSDLFRPDWFAGGTDWLEPEKLRRRKAELDAAVSTISTDLHPVVYLQRLALWEEMTGGRSHAIFERLRSVGCTEFIVALLGVAGATLLVSYVRARSGQRRRRQAAGSRNGVASPLVGDVSGFQPDLRTAWFADSAITLSVGTTGFVTMALSIIFLFAFQNLYGYVYQRIGWIVALFMAGLVVGCGLISWRSQRIRDTAGAVAGLWAGLIAVDGLLTLLALTIPFVLPWLGSLQNAPVTFAVVEWCISLLVLVTGALGGAAFALGGALRLSATGRPGAAAGSVVGADHVGACLGALLCGIVLVPVFGTATAAFLLAGIKLSSAALLGVGRHLATSGVNRPRS